MTATKQQEYGYAVYQINHTFYGVGATREAAIADAKQWMDSHDAEITDFLPGRGVDGEVVIVRVSQALMALISAEGGLVQFSQDGQYFDITD